MGMSNGSFVQIDMRAAYALVSWATSRTRLTVRYDYFDATDRDGTEERNDDRGRAWTAAFFWNPVESLRIGIEYVDLDADPRAAAEDSGFDPDTDGRRVTLEARFSF
jgi:phosphate-selective porin